MIYWVISSVILLIILRYVRKFVEVKLLELIRYLGIRLAERLKYPPAGYFVDSISLTSLILSLVILVFVIINYDNQITQLFLLFIQIITSLISIILVVTSLHIRKNTHGSKGIFPSLDKILSYKKENYWVGRIVPFIEQFASFTFLVLLVVIQFLLYVNFFDNKDPKGYFVLFNIAPIYTSIWVNWWSKTNDKVSVRRVVAYFIIAAITIVVSYFQFIEWAKSPSESPQIGGKQWLIALNIGVFITLDRLFKGIQDDQKQYKPPVKEHK